jgi:hypothetical protein
LGEGIFSKNDAHLLKFQLFKFFFGPLQRLQFCTYNMSTPAMSTAAWLDGVLVAAGQSALALGDDPHALRGALADGVALSIVAARCGFEFCEDGNHVINGTVAVLIQAGETGSSRVRIALTPLRELCVFFIYLSQSQIRARGAGCAWPCFLARPLASARVVFHRIAGRRSAPMPGGGTFRWGVWPVW